LKNPVLVGKGICCLNSDKREYAENPKGLDYSVRRWPVQSASSGNVMHTAPRRCASRQIYNIAAGGQSLDIRFTRPSCDCKGCPGVRAAHGRADTRSWAGIGVGFQTVGAAPLDDRRAGLPLLKDGELLLGGNASSSAAFNSWILVHWHKVKQAFQISTGADQKPFHGPVTPFRGVLE
jgi:hypothetical protein